MDLYFIWVKIGALLCFELCFAVNLMDSFALFWNFVLVIEGLTWFRR